MRNSSISRVASLRAPDHVSRASYQGSIRFRTRLYYPRVAVMAISRLGTGSVAGPLWLAKGAYYGICHIFPGEY